MDEHELIAAVASGDDRALRALFDRHASWIAVRLRRALPLHVFEDVLQETFLAVWRSAGRYKAEVAVGASIWGIARRQAAPWARKHGRPELVVDPIPLEEHEPAAAGIGMLVISLHGACESPGELE